MTDPSSRTAPQDERDGAAALMLVSGGGTAAELAERAAAIDMSAALARLAALGLVRVASGDRDDRRYVLTEFGRRHVEASPLAQPGVVAALEDLEQLRSDL